jgi:tRNA threonylcarbamoyladenosine biosynthesis protein TsaB
MIVLGIETATIACGVALAGPDGALGALQVATRLTHSQRLMPLIDSLFRETGIARSELDGIAVSCGPGSFTGLRIGVATAKALALALDLPLIGVPTLAVLAENAGPAAELVWPVLVAKRDEIYGAVYRRHAGEALTIVAEPWAGPPAEFLSRAESVTTGLQVEPTGHAQRTDQAQPTPAWLCGDALTRFRDAIDIETATSNRRLVRLDATAALPQAATVATLGRQALLRGEGVDAAALAPFYVRRPQAELVWDAREREGAVSNER